MQTKAAKHGMDYIELLLSVLFILRNDPEYVSKPVKLISSVTVFIKLTIGFLSKSGLFYLSLDTSQSFF